MASLPIADQNGYPYEVFLSFRGKDTRFAFTDHLYKALCDRGIMTFRDDDELRRGEEISPALLKAIQESMASIIVFSENYASSWWCLDELVKILECRKSKGQEVRSVFYKVDPSDVRHQTGSVGEAFAKLDQCKYKDSMDKWRGALKEAAHLSGWTFKEGEYESEFIDKIVGELSARVVNPSYELPVAEHPVGIEFCRREIESLLDVEEENAVRMVGIWGTGGIGKTTIAQDVYNSIRHKFESSCFLAVDGTNSSPDQSLAKLQETLLSGIVRDPTLKVRNVDEGISFIKKKMRQKKVLLILDDVSDSNHLKKLAPSSECFGPGSRIIITTRDKRWLTAHQVDSIYEVKVLNNDGALELFSWHAFKCNGPPDDFLEPAKDAVHYAQGLPLALIVLGSHLFKRSRDEWEAILDSCKGEPQREIQSVLRRSYDALNDCAKQLFLDIACFFKGTSVDKARPILEACGRNPRIGMKLLVEKALIRIDGDEIWIHDLIEEMGKDLVLQEGEPRERSRLWNIEDVNVLTNNTGTNKIEGVQVRWQWGQWGDNEICLNAKSFSQMKNLRYFSSTSYLNAKGIQEHFAGNIDFLSNQLRWFNWPKCPIQSFPLNFHPRELVALNIPNSCITRLWEGRKDFPFLTSMNLSGCASLIELPDFTGIPNLKELNLYGCTSLVEVHRSVGSLSRLENLYVDHCSNLVTLPRAFSLKSVQTISLINCKRLEEFPKIVGKMDSLRCLDLLGSGIKELHPSIGNLIGLKRLDLSGCQNLTTLPSNIDMLQNLETLDLSKCSKLATFPEIDREMGFLRKLDLSDRGIKELHTSIGNLIGMKDLSLRWCKNLTTLPCSIDGLQNLENLDLSGCSNLATFPEINRKMDSLRKLHLSNSGIKELHPSIGNLIGLEELFLNGCENLSKLPCNIYRWQNLERLFLSRCSKLVTFPRNSKSLHDDDNGDGSLSLPKLKELIMKGCNLSDGDFLMTFDCVETLTKLDLSSNSFVSLPACISKFVNLEKLDLHCCKRLRDIPELPPNVVEVDVSDCDSLEKFWKLSKVLEGKESQGIKWINLWNCNRLCNNLEYNMDKLERILLNNQNNSPFGVVFPGSTSEVPKWFDCRVDVIGNENGHRNLFEFSIRISENLKWEKIGLAICAVFERGDEYCCCDYEVSINKVCIRPFDLYYLRTSNCIISRSDHVWLYYIPLPVERKAEVDDQKGCSSQQPYYTCRVRFRHYPVADGIPKSCGIHLVCQQSKDDEYSSNKVGGGGVEPTEQKRHRGANDTSFLESQNHQQKKHCGPNSM